VQTVPPSRTFAWPDGVRCAVSLTFDDTRSTQADFGLPILAETDTKATFYVWPRLMGDRIDLWREAVKRGHEFGNHTVSHPCTGNLEFTRANAVEDYTLERMDDELARANEIIETSLSATPETFAYPCGGTFVGRGAETRSYVPLVARRFLAGRGYWEPYPNAPGLCDLAHLLGCSFDALPFDTVKGYIDRTIAEGGWLILVGRDILKENWQGVNPAVLRRVCEYLKKPENGIWTGPVAEIARYVRAQRGA